MAIGTTIATSIPTVGTTTYSYTLLSYGRQYKAAGITLGTGTADAILTLRPAGSLGKSKRLGFTAKVTPSDYDDPGTLTKGSCTISVNIDATEGSVVTKAAIAAFARQTLSVGLKASLIEDLLAGSVV